MSTSLSERNQSEGAGVQWVDLKLHEQYEQEQKTPEDWKYGGLTGEGYFLIKVKSNTGSRLQL